MPLNITRQLTECGHGVQTVNDAEVVKLGAVADDGVAECLEVLMFKDLSPVPLCSSASRGLTVSLVPDGASRGCGLQQLSDLLQGDRVVVVGDFCGVLGDPAQHLVGTTRALDQPLHGEERVVTHLLVDKVPRLLLAGGGPSSRTSASICVEGGMVLVVGRQKGWGQVVGLRVGVIVVVEVRSSVGVGAALVQRVGGGRWGWVRVVGEVGCLEHSQTRPSPLFDPAPSASPTSSSPRVAVEAGGVHGDRLSSKAEGAGREAASSAQEAPPSGETQHSPITRPPGGNRTALLWRHTGWSGAGEQGN